MNGRYHLIYEPSLSLIGAFPSRDDALAYVEKLRAVNTDDFLDELTVSGDKGPELFGQSLRDELARRAERKEKGNG